MDTPISNFWKLQAIPLFKYAIQYFISCFVSGNIFVFWVLIERLGIVNEKPSQVSFNNSFHTSLNSTRLWILLCIDAQWLTDNYNYIYHQAIKESQCSTSEITAVMMSQVLVWRHIYCFFFLVVLIIRNIRKKIVLNFYSVLHFTLVKFCCLSKRFASS